MSNNNIKILLDEAKEVIQELKTQAEKTTAWDPTEKANLEKRLNHLLDKSNPRHTNLTQDLQTDLKELIEIEKAIGAERIEQAKKQKELEDKNKQLEQDNQIKDQQIKEKDEQIGQKITADFITSLGNLTKDGVKLDETKLTELKTLLEKVENKEVKADLTETDKKIEEVGKKVEQVQSSSTSPWSIIGCILGGLSFLIMVYLVLTRNQETKPSVDKEE